MSLSCDTLTVVLIFLIASGDILSKLLKKNKKPETVLFSFNFVRTAETRRTERFVDKKISDFNLNSFFSDYVGTKKKYFHFIDTYTITTRTSWLPVVIVSNNFFVIGISFYKHINSL